MGAEGQNYALFVDPDIPADCRNLLPDGMVILADAEGGEEPAPAPGRSCLAALVSPMNAPGWRLRLRERGLADLPVIEVDPASPERASQNLFGLLSQRMLAAERELGEMRAASAMLRREGQSDKTRFRAIESFLYALGEPQIARILSWEPTGVIGHMTRDTVLLQRLPIDAVSITAVDLWLPDLPRNRDLGLTVAVIDANGETLEMTEAYGGQETRSGWVRYLLDAPLPGDPRNCSLMLRYTGAARLAVGMGPRVPDPRFAAKGDGFDNDMVLALRVWKAVAGASLPDEPLVLHSPLGDGRHARFLSAGELPEPELFAKPASATDYVTADYWENEDAIMVHPSRSGPVCAVLRDVALPRLSHITAVVTVGHPQAPNLNLAVGVAPAGLVGRDGFWQGRIGPWVHGLPALGWAQAHCVPSEPIRDRADIFLAASLAHDGPNDLSWALFRGLRVVTGAPLDEAEE
ncbi:DUF6212 domain-containing protein [Paracoccus sp. (in: a-proteobacteria)]|uniref:DUF6212 domain-containing protein n=1 Tax=Paracoccus sp. TaxID=267 RepID=UPI00272B7BD5|nr:DUF6212 domain-containing protein [Paracoccus sp. (in: a-proteobacteria)]